MVTLKAKKGECMSVIQKSVTVHEDNDQWMFPTFEPEQSIKLTLFPNPNLGNFNALIELDEPSDLQIRIYNQEALAVYSAQFESVQVLSQNIDLSGSIPGIYTMLIHSDRGLEIRQFCNRVILSFSDFFNDFTLARRDLHKVLRCLEMT